MNSLGSQSISQSVSRKAKTQFSTILFYIFSYKKESVKKLILILEKSFRWSSDAHLWQFICIISIIFHLVFFDLSLMVSFFYS